MLGCARVVIVVVVRWEGGDTRCVHLAHRSAVFDLFWIQLEMKLDWKSGGLRGRLSSCTGKCVLISKVIRWHDYDTHNYQVHLGSSWKADWRLNDLICGMIHAYPACAGPIIFLSFLFQKEPVNDQSFLLIMRASHVIKGASSNLMCQQLREGATNLEHAAAGANEIPTEDQASLDAAMEKVREKHVELMKGVESYHAFLKSVDI